LILVEKLRTLLEWRARGSGDLDLRPLIDEVACAWPFTEAAIDISPTAPGVYRLYRNGRLIYIGLALNGAGIRRELESHRQGAHGSCTQGATAFLCEIAADPLATYRRYLDMHRARYAGRLPPCQNGNAGEGTC
jgi:hypothetical protein